MKLGWDNLTSADLVHRLKKIEQENRILRKKLSRSESTRSELETASQRRELMLKHVIEEAEKAKLDLEKAKEIADSANKAKSEFLANMSHELRTPLNGILGYAQILVRTEKLSEEGKTGLNVIYQCGDHLLTLINDILDISKIEAHKLDLMHQSFNLQSFLKNVVEICRVHADQKGIKFYYQADEKLPINVIADERRLRQILINLLGNAVKFTHSGQVILRVGLVQGHVNTYRNRLRFEIQDTGVGIQPKQIEKICLPFEQASDSMLREGGTGLGLAITRQILQMMGSALEIESEFGVGSQFSFEVDLLTSNEQQQLNFGEVGQQIIGYEGKEKVILVVDDRWENRYVLTSLLTQVGFKVLEAKNGEQALELLAAIHPDLIILDLLMPVMDGFELLSRLSHDRNLRDTPKVVSSASAFEGDRRKSLAAGAIAFLPEPIKVDDLLELLKVHLHLQWIYSDVSAVDHSQPAENEAVLVRPPSDVIMELRKLVRRGDLDALIQAARKLDGEYRKFAETVIAMSESFQVKQLKKFLKSTP